MWHGVLAKVCRVLIETEGAVDDGHAEAEDSERRGGFGAIESFLRVHQMNHSITSLHSLNQSGPLP